MTKITESEIEQAATFHFPRCAVANIDEWGN